MNLLFVVHNYPGNGPLIGGTELHARDLAERLSRATDNRVYVMFPVDGPDRRFFVIRDLKTNTQERIGITTPITWDSYHHADFAEQVRALIERRTIDLVHFFHMIHYPLAFPLYAKQAGAATVMANHDYYLVCRQLNLLTAGESRFCGFPQVTEQDCDRCLRRTFGYAPGTQHRRRELISDVLRHVDGFHYVCRDERDRIVAAYPHLAGARELLNGSGLPGNLPVVAANPADSARLPGTSAVSCGPDRPLQVACIGNFAKQKGADVLIGLFNYYGMLHDIGEPVTVQFHVLGLHRYPYGAAVRSVARPDIVKVSGRYRAEQLPVLLQDCDVALFASIWPETWSLVLSEAWATGLVPIAPRMGAFGERITHDVNGQLYDSVDGPDDIIRVLDNLATDRGRLTRMQQTVRDRSATPIASIDDNIRRYLEFWQTVIAESAVDGVKLSPSAAGPEYVTQTERAPVVVATRSPAELVRRAWMLYQRCGLRYMLRSALRYGSFRRAARSGR